MTERRYSIKCWKEFFAAIETGEKTFEVRKNDRGYQVGDQVDICEFDAEKAVTTGRVIPVVITYVFDSRATIPHGEADRTIVGSTASPIMPGYCVWGFRVLPDPEGAPV